MANQTNYKRTVAGSIGAGVGAIFNGSGRTYYILEHKTNSQYHNAGESQKIIIDQIEMGRDASCQVRFDESFETVSRKHAAIVRDGDNWQLVHLSTSNPTLVNGQPIHGHYYLQSGDEIQLSQGGPRMGFIVPQGKQGLTSSIKLTERMNLFRQQALRPYRRAIWALATLLVLVIVGFGGWNLMLSNQLSQQKAEAAALKAQAVELNEQIAKLESSAEKTPEMLKQIETLKQQRSQVITSYRTIVKEVEKKDPKIVDELYDEGVLDDVMDPDLVDQDATDNNLADAKGDLRDYYPNIYRIIIEEITLERGGIARNAGIATSNIDCGTGFILTNGTFVTARQNVQPWLYINGIAPTGWRADLAKFVSMGFDVKMKFAAYSTSGPAQKMEISSRDFDLPEAGDVVSATVSISKNDWEYVQGLGFAISKDDMKRTGTNIKVSAPRGRAYALYHGTGRPGIPANNGAAQSLAGGQEILICGYTSNNVQNLAGSVNYFKTSTSVADTKYSTIKVQNSPGTAGYMGAPAFIQDADGNFSIVGVFVGNGSIVPISRCH